MGDSNNKRKWTCELGNYPNLKLKTSKSVKGFTNEYKIINYGSIEKFNLIQLMTISSVKR